MSVHHSTARLVLTARKPYMSATSIQDVCFCFNGLRLSKSRTFHSSHSPRAGVNLHPELPQQWTGAKSTQGGNMLELSTPGLAKKPEHLKLTPEQRAAAAAKRARENLRKQEAEAQANQKFGSLASNSIFADEDVPEEVKEDVGKGETERDSADFSQRSFTNMARALYPRPHARSRWQRRMVIRHIKHSGRLPKAIMIARTERSHLSRSHFFKTSMKKLAPLARQIAGKPIDEAILQMRFSKKKVAQEVREHLIQARDEAIVTKGMGLKPALEGLEQGSSTESEPPPSTTQPLVVRQPTGTTEHEQSPKETDIYVAEAWTNRGQYGQAPDFRARGRVNMLRPPHTGISILLKEEKTRTRIAMEKETKEIKRRLGKNMWTQLPDRKITNQSQYVLW